ncbi:CBS domain-containing protein [methane-oxidizing endosymbiont of Gigantopelta aegis]|uniref:CBS domain-containing protein n=1 Tax=methane-oxidizing endosymbiont of Gigantopelta aegis TaxID=2794938 RepID=UPI0018DEBA6D|nr:CBS domain-containing protein [methane-oxidizing endosymbiont of Gigantopelta aegis]
MLAKITIADYMTKNIFTLKENVSVVTAIKAILDHKITSAPVLDDNGRLIGMFSEKDSIKVVLDAAYNKDFGGTVGEFMAKDIITVNEDDNIVKLAEQFQNCATRSFPVMDEDKLVGVISRTDVLRALVTLY